MRIYFLMFILAFLCYKFGYSQKIDVNDPSIVQLQKVYNEAVRLCIVNEKLQWSSAVMISDATVNHILKAEFNTAERYVRAADKESSMIKIDSCIQFTIILNAFQSCPELSNVKMNDKKALIKAIQGGRKTTPFPKIAMGMSSINTGSSIQFASHIIQNRMDGLDIFFNDLDKFESVKDELHKLAMLLSKSEVRFRSFVGKGADTSKLICSFFDKSGILSQLKLSYAPQDYFGKIQGVEFVEKSDFINDLSGPIALD